MAESIVSDIVGKVLEYAGKSIASKVAPYFGGRKKLDELRVTLTMIQACLSDAEKLHEGQRGDLINKWLGELKNVMYDLEDLFEEVDANGKENQQRPSSSKLSKTVHLLPSKFISLGMNKKVAREGESILHKLNHLKDTMNGLGLVPREVNVGDSQSRLNLDDVRETQSFIPEGKVIGRDEDRDVIVDMLFKSNNVGEVLSVIPIVGMGGLGKTALAQFVFNDQKVQRFYGFRYWACISYKISRPKELIGKVFQSMTGDQRWPHWDLEKLQCEFRKFVEGKKILLVLDDIWDEDMDWWIRLRDLICVCESGSAVLVTTRSHVVALNMTTVEPYYDLQGLSEDQSWLLFKSLAFRKDRVESCPNFANIGREIVQKCANVPLAIRTIAGLLYSRSEEEWMQFRDKEIGVIDRKGDVMSTLKLSYYHLQPQERQCFSYCSLYPKDYEFNIRDLVWRWMSQGFVSSVDDDLGVFKELLRTCFFQDVTRDKYGIMEGCKMHDLMHDLAKSVGDECLILDKPVDNINGNVRHVTVIIGDKDSLSPLEASWMCASPPIRSFFLPFRSLFDCHVIFLRLRRLRVLDLGDNCRYKNLPDSIGKLLHLRYLKANVECLPEGITTLQNLQVLNVWAEKLPRDIHKLTSLRHLEIRNNNRCRMSPGIGKLLNLETLSTFVVGNEGLDALAGLNLTGKLTINFRENRENAISEAMMSNLKGKKLTHLSFWRDGWNEIDPKDDDEVLNCLPLPSTLEILEIGCLHGVRRLRLGVHDLPNIVCITIINCSRIQQLPSLGGLPHLKTLELSHIYALKFIENGSGKNNGTIASSGAIYFPSLEMLTLSDLWNLKGWLRIEETDIDEQVEQCHQLHCFPRLQTLKMKSCRKLRSMPWSQLAALNFRMSQMLENLDIGDCDALDLWVVGNNNGNKVDIDSVNLSAWEGLQRLCSLRLVWISRLESLPSGIAAMTRLQSLEIDYLCNLKIIPEWIGQLTLLRSLSIKHCYPVEALPRSIRNLNALKELYIWTCPKLKSRCEEPDGEDWPLIQHITYRDIRGFS